MANPIVLTSCDTVTVNGLTASAAPATYLTALARDGLVPLQVPTIAAPFDLGATLDVAAGVLLTGARSNVHPRRYGVGESERSAPFDLARDRTVFALIEGALTRRLPLFCICRGHQELNVAFGGSLHPAVHEVPGRSDHRGADTVDMDHRFGLAHTVTVEPGGRLAEIVGAGSITVNSVHRQAIDRLGAGLAVEARAPDGTVEATSVVGAPFALSVQWHPEHFAGAAGAAPHGAVEMADALGSRPGTHAAIQPDAPSAALFKAFAEAVRVAAEAAPDQTVRAA